jgi:hypothetical protein
MVENFGKFKKAWLDNKLGMHPSHLIGFVRIRVMYTGLEAPTCFSCFMALLHLRSHYHLNETHF